MAKINTKTRDAVDVGKEEHLSTAVKGTNLNSHHGDKCGGSQEPRNRCTM